MHMAVMELSLKIWCKYLHSIRRY